VKRWTPAWLAIAAFLLYVPAVGWGRPQATDAESARAWGVDDETPLGPLAQVHNMIEPKAFQNLGYPLMHSLLIVGAYAPYLGVLWARGGFANPRADYPYGFRYPAATLRRLKVIASLVSVVLAVGIVVATWYGTKALVDSITALVAAGLTTVSFPMFYYSRTGNVDVPMMFFVAVALAAFARCLSERDGFTVRRALALGIGVGAAVATKEPAAAAFLGVPVVLLARHWRVRGRGGGWKTGGFWRPPLVALASCVLMFGIGSGWFLDPPRFYAHLAFIGERVGSAATGSVEFVRTYPMTMAGHLALTGRLLGLLADAMTGPGVALALVGMVLAWRRRSPVGWMVVPAATYYAVLFLSARIGMLRYMMPVALPLTVLTAFALTRLAAAPVRVVRAGAVVLGAGMLAVGLLRGADLTWAMLHDSRYAAGEWLASTLRPGDRIEYFGSRQKLPDVPAGVQVSLATPYRGAIRDAGGPEGPPSVAEHLAAHGAGYLIVMPDHSSPPQAEHSATCPVSVYRRLLDGSLGYELAETFHHPRLFPWLPRPELDYPVVNPPIRVFHRRAG